MPGDAPHHNSAKGANKPSESKKAKDSVAEVAVEDENIVQGKSVLQGKLTKLAIQIGYAGMYMGLMRLTPCKKLHLIRTLYRSQSLYDYFVLHSIIEWYQGG